MERKPTMSQQQLIEKVLYILQKTGGIDYYRIFKILYFAEQAYLSRFYRKIVEDEFRALPYGPVPTNLYNAIRNGGYDSPLACALWDVVRYAGEDAPTVLLPLRDANMDYIAKYEVDTLDEMIAMYASKSFKELMQLSHNTAWSSTDHCKAMSSEAIALEGGLDSEDLPYLREQLEWQAIEHKSAS